MGLNLCKLFGVSSAWDLVGLYNSAECVSGEKKLKSFMEEIKRKLYFLIFHYKNRLTPGLNSRLDNEDTQQNNLERKKNLLMF